MASLWTRFRRTWITLIVLLGLVGAYALFGFYGVPALVQSVARTQVEKIGRKIEIGQVAFNPFTFEASIDGLKLTEGDGSPLLAFEHLGVDVQVGASIWERGAILDYLHLKAPDIALVVEKDGSVNLAKLVPPSDEPDEPPGPPPRVRIGALSIERGRLGIEDRSRPQPFATALTPIEFTLTDFRTDLDYGSAYHLMAATAAGEELEWSGDFSVQPIGSRGSFAVRKLQATTIASYLQDQLPVKLLSGVIGLSGSYEMTLDPTLALDLKLPAVTIDQIAVAEKKSPASQRPPLSVAQISVEDIAVSLARRDVKLRRVAISGLNADVFREADGSINLTRLAGPPAPADAKPAAAAAVAAEPGKPAESPWQVAIGSIDLLKSSINAEDRTMKPAMRVSLSPIAVNVKGYSSTSNQLQIRADLGIAKTGRLKTEGSLQLKPLATQLALDLQNIDVTLAQPYIAGLTPARLKSALLGVKGQLSYATHENAQATMSFTGDASLGSLRVQDRAQTQDLLKWRDLQIQGIAFQQAPDKLDIERITLVEPYTSVVIAKDRSINLSQAMAPNKPAAKTADAPLATVTKKTKSTTPAGKTMPVRLKTLRIEGGELLFADQSIEPSFAAGIKALKGEITGLSTLPSSRAKLHLEGQVDKFSPVLIDGESSPMAFDRYTDIALSFRNMDLIRFNPYSGRFAGYNITKGKLTTELKYSIRNRQLAAQHHVIVDQLEFGDATGSKQAVPLPVKLAVGLLKDRHGVIDLELPVNGSLDDPTFKIGPLIGKTLVNLLTKAVTAPFSMLARLFGGSGEELAYVDFAPGADGMSLGEAEKIDKLATALIERPQLKLDIPLTFSAANDGAEIAKIALEQRLFQITTANAAPKATAKKVARDLPRPGLLESPETIASKRLVALEQLHRQLLQAAPPASVTETGARIAFLEKALQTALTPDAAALDQLARARADNVQAMLLAHPEIKAERLYLTARQTSSLSESGAVRMELQLQ